MANRNLTDKVLKNLTLSKHKTADHSNNNTTKAISLTEFAGKKDGSNNKRQIDAVRDKIKNTDFHIAVCLAGSPLEGAKYPEILSDFKSNYQCRISLLVSAQGKNLSGFNQFTDILGNPQIYSQEDFPLEKNLIESFDLILVPVMTQNTIAKLALGIQDVILPSVLWQSLWLNKEVYVDYSKVVNYKGYEQGNAAQISMMEGYRTTLGEFGVKELSPEKLPEILAESVKTHNNQKPNENSLSRFYSSSEATSDNKQVITEGDIEKWHQNQHQNQSQNIIKLPKNAIITPLARDKVRELNLNLEID